MYHRFVWEFELREQIIKSNRLEYKCITKTSHYETLDIDPRKESQKILFIYIK